MKKMLLITISLCTIIILAKYFISDYELNYEVDGYKIKEIYKDKRFYIEINKDITYNLEFYQKRSFSKTLISNIKEIKGEDFTCIYPTIKNVETYPLCYKNNEYIDYNLIESELLEEYKIEEINIDLKKDFNYYKTLNKDTYVALWTYKGYIIMNDNVYNKIDIFKKDRYDNSLSYLYKNKIYMPNYDQEHEFNELVYLNLETGETNIISLGYKLDYDSYIVGNIKHKLYIFDNKHSILYEINLKNKKTKIKSDSSMGYVKYVDGEFVSCSKTEYKIDKIKYNINESNYIYEYNNWIYKTIKDNKNIKTKIINEKIDIIDEYNNELYYIYEDNFYYYTPNKGIKKVFYNYELTFNKDNSIFVYIK